jgi:predicted nucleic acid-binding protein
VILLDTSVLSRVFRRARPGTEERRLHQRLHELLAGEAALGIPGLVLQEVLSGIRSEKQFSNLMQRLLTSFSIVLPHTSDHIEAARLRNKGLSKGVTISGSDCLIAALAITGDHELCTMDRDFETIARFSSLKLFRFESKR